MKSERFVPLRLETSELLYPCFSQPCAPEGPADFYVDQKSQRILCIIIEINPVISYIYLYMTCYLQRYFHYKNSTRFELEVHQQSQFLELCNLICGSLSNSSISKSYDRNKLGAADGLAKYLTDREHVCPAGFIGCRFMN